MRPTERFVLLYSLFWIGVIATVTFTRAFAHWGDAGHMVLGLGLALPLWLAPLRLGREATRFVLWITLFSFLQVYFGSALFFDGLGMEYHFNTRLILNRTPVFLYFLTVAYFATYYVIMSLAWRALGRRWWALPLIGFAMAFAETASMANPLLKDVFLYRDKAFALGWGSACYGTIFVLSLPFVDSLEERKPSLKQVVFEVLAVNMLALILYEVFFALLRR